MKNTKKLLVMGVFTAVLIIIFVNMLSSTPFGIERAIEKAESLRLELEMKRAPEQAPAGSLQFRR